MANLNSSDVVLSDTIRSILVAFEAPPPVIEQFRLDHVRGDPFAWAQSFYNFRRMEDDFGTKLIVLFVLTGL